MTVAEPSSTGPISLAGDKVMSRNGTEKSLVICVPLGTTPLPSGCLRRFRAGLSHETLHFLVGVLHHSAIAWVIACRIHEGMDRPGSVATRARVCSTERNGDAAFYAHVSDRYCDMARTLGVEGHIAWAGDA